MENNKAVKVKKIRVGDIVRMTDDFCATLSHDDRRNEKRRTYRVTDVRSGNFAGLTIVEMVDGRNRETNASIESVQRLDPAAVALGRKGGKARAAKLTPAQKADSARSAAVARWSKKGSK